MFSSLILSSFLFTQAALAQSAVSQVTVAQEGSQAYELPAMTLESTTRNIPAQPVNEKKIVSGKKVTTVNEKNIPVVPNNNYRQTIAEIPGLMTSEVNNESFISMTTRGLGDPHEGFNILMLRDGIPMAADPYGYPAAYYSPPTEALSKIEFYRGGAGLLFGPQPGGALNFKLRSSPNQWQEGRILTRNLGGSFGRYSTYTEATGGKEKWGYLGAFHARGTEGFREKNNDSKILNPRLNFSWNPKQSRRVILDLDVYQGRFGEAGGLARTSGANVYSLDDGYKKTTLENDRLEIDRQAMGITWEEDWTSRRTTSTTFWMTSLERGSFRQGLGGNPAFGGIAVGTTNTIQVQKFNTYGVDSRYLETYDLLGETHHFTAALTATSTQSPFRQETGASPTASSGTQTKSIDRETETQALALENAFKSGRLTVTPGVRFESIKQKVDEKQNAGSAVPLRNFSETESISLLGLGLQYQLAKDYQTYVNLSEGYKPPAYQDTVPLGTGDLISEDIKEAKTWSREVGIRGQFAKIEADISVFKINYTNQFGRNGNVLENIGASESEGMDVSLSSALNDSFNLHLGGAWLKSRITTGALEGNATQYSPSSLIRAGLSHMYGNKSSVRLQGQWVEKHYGDDAHTANFKIPGYSLYDLTGEHGIGKLWGSEESKVLYGVQNLLDEKYFSRIRSNGIEPGQPRSLFAGLSLVF